MILLSFCQGLSVAFVAATQYEEEDCTVVAKLDEIHKVFFCSLPFSKMDSVMIFLSYSIFLI